LVLGNEGEPLPDACTMAAPDCNTAGQPCGLYRTRRCMPLRGCATAKYYCE
jgi:hypothetical protein